MQQLKVIKTQKEFQGLLGSKVGSFDSKIQKTASRVIGLDISNSDKEVIAATAMGLMVNGVAGVELDRRLVSKFGKDRVAKADIKSIRDSYEGILGRVYHDPKLFDSCKEAKVSLQSNSLADENIVIRRMAKCSTCSLRSVDRCNLMNKTLVSSLDEIAPKLVVLTVKKERVRGNIDRVKDIFSSKVSDLKKLQAYNKISDSLESSVVDTGKYIGNKVSSMFVSDPIEFDVRTSSKRSVTASKIEGKDFNVDVKLPKLKVGKVEKLVDNQYNVESSKIFTELVAHPLKDRGFWSSDKVRKWASVKLDKFRSLEVPEVNKVEAKQIIGVLKSIIRRSSDSLVTS